MKYAGGLEGRNDLFGSHAYGRPKPWSDVDLLVVMDTPEGEWPVTKAIKLAMPDCSFSLDILVRSQAKKTIVWR